MAIWFKPVQLAEVNALGKNTLLDLLKIELIELGEDFLVGRMEVGPNMHQPMGIMHGGISCVLAETLGSIAASLCVDCARQVIVGLDINTNHLRQVISGTITGITKPFQVGRKIQVWGIEIFNAENQLVSISRLTVMALEK